MNQNPLGQLGPQGQTNESEISLLDIFVFLGRSYKLIALFGIFGIVTSYGYLINTPKQYQASAQIQMAQSKLSGTNIEYPALLIARLSSPLSYTVEVANACGLGSEKNAQAILSKSVMLTQPKGMDNIVDLKTIGTSPDTAVICAQSVFDLIKVTQAKKFKPYLEEAKANLLDAQERLAMAKDLLAKADKTGLIMGAAVYLSTRDEIQLLVDQITALKNVIFFNENSATRLVAPIYVSDDPIAPKKRVVYLAGLFGGLFLGLLIAVGRQILPSLKAQLEKNTLPK